MTVHLVGVCVESPLQQQPSVHPAQVQAIRAIKIQFYHTREYYFLQSGASHPNFLPKNSIGAIFPIRTNKLLFSVIFTGRKRSFVDPAVLYAPDVDFEVRLDA